MGILKNSDTGQDHERIIYFYSKKKDTKKMEIIKKKLTPFHSSTLRWATKLCNNVCAHKKLVEAGIYRLATNSLGPYGKSASSVNSEPLGPIAILGVLILT